MRAPFQILAIPYRFTKDELQVCVLHRSDIDQWQFVAGGGEDSETPIEAAKREVLEESGIKVENIIKLTSMCYVPTNIFPQKHLYNWPHDTYVVPEYSFAFECDTEIALSNEHTESVWLSYGKAFQLLKWDSNRTALYELNCRISL